MYVCIYKNYSYSTTTTILQVVSVVIIIAIVVAVTTTTTTTSTYNCHSRFYNRLEFKLMTLGCQKLKHLNSNKLSAEYENWFRLFVQKSKYNARLFNKQAQGAGNI